MTDSVTGELSESEAQNIFHVIKRDKIACPVTGSTRWNVHWRLVVMENFGGDADKDATIPLIMINNKDSGYTMFFSARFFKGLHLV